MLRKAQLASPFQRAVLDPPLQPGVLTSSLAAPPVFDRRGSRSARMNAVRRLEKRVIWISAVCLSLWLAWGGIVEFAAPLHKIAG